MVNYSIAKIYKITGPKDSSQCYIGSTVQPLHKRYIDHKAGYRSWKSGRCPDNITAYKIFDSYGIDNCKIIELEKCNITTRSELLQREQYYMDQYQSSCVNARPAYLEPHARLTARQVSSKRFEEKIAARLKLWKETHAHLY